MLRLAVVFLGLVAAGPVAERSIHPVEERQLPAGDPCGRLVGSTPYYAPRTILACVQSIAFKPEVRTNIMGVANAMYNGLDVLAANQLGDSEEPVNQGVDIQSEFNRINSTSYDSDFDFQFDLARSMTLLNDGHHAWSSCYRSLFSTTHAIPIVSLSSSAESTDPNIYIVPDVARFVSAAGFTTLYANAGIDVASLAGAQVLQIEGMPAWDYLEQVKLPVTGVYTDRQQRLNSVFASYAADGGVWGRVPGRFTSTRDWTKNNMTMQVRTKAGATEEVVIPWVVRYAGTRAWSYATGEAFWTANCGTARPITVRETTGASNGTAAPIGPTRAPTEADLTRLALSAYRSCPATRNLLGIPVPTSEDPLRSSAYLGGRDAMFFAIPNTKTGVVFLPTFLPEPASNACVTRYFVDLVFGLRNFTRAGIENVLIDTSNNGGGAVVLSQVAQVLFTGQRFANEANFESVLRRSPLSEAFLQRFLDNPSLANVFSTFNPTTYRSGSSNLARDNNYFSPGREYNINSMTLRTSNLLRDSLEQIDLLDMLFNIPDAAPFPPQNIVFTGNGLCGSACGSFTSFLVEYFNGTGYIQAAQPSKPIEFSAFLAGQAFTTEAVYEEAAILGFNNTALLPRLNHAGSFGFAIRAAISPNIAPGEFLQYRSFPAANRFALTEERYLNQMASWEYIASQAFPREGNFEGATSNGGGTGGSGSGSGAGSSARASMAMMRPGHVVAIVMGVCLYCIL